LAANKCNADLGTSWAGDACIRAVEDQGDQAIVEGLGDEACARAPLGVSDSALASASCTEARSKAEKAAWLEIEKEAKYGQKPNLSLDYLVPGLPRDVHPTVIGSETPSTSDSQTQTQISVSSQRQALSAEEGLEDIAPKFRDLTFGQAPKRSPQQVCKRDQAARRFGAVSFTGIPSSNSCPS